MRWGWALGALAALSCVGEADPRPQAVVWVDTDAPSPRMIDRLRIEVLADRGGTLGRACDACAREIAISSGDEWPVSFGVVPPEGAGAAWVRVTGFPTGRTTLGVPDVTTAIEAVARLVVEPGAPPSHVEVVLSLGCAGLPADLDARLVCEGGRVGPIGDAAPRGDAPSRVGTFRASHARGCDGEPRPSTGRHDAEVCVPGGTFWMGDLRRQGFGPAFDGVPEHAVTVSPFYMDVYELTVGRYRAALAAGYEPTSAPALRVVGTPTEHCNLYVGPDDLELDDHPLNCVTAWEAASICAWEGKRLPTEAEWEWAAGGREEERLYPWHERSYDICTGFIRESCMGPAGTGPVGAYPGDVTLDGIYDMGANVIEWLEDLFQSYADSCWTPGAYGPDPVCAPAPEVPVHGRSTRGGSWNEGGVYHFMVGTRRFFPPSSRDSLVGVRCVRDG